MTAADHKTNGELVLDGKEQAPVPQGFICFDDIYRPPNTSAALGRERLAQAGFLWMGRYEKGHRGMVRYYEEAAKDFFRHKPLPKKATASHISLNQLASRYGIAPTTLRTLAPGSGLYIEQMIGTGRSAPHIHIGLIAHMDRYIKQVMPLVEEGAISTADLAQETGTTTSFLNLG